MKKSTTSMVSVEDYLNANISILSQYLNGPGNIFLQQYLEQMSDEGKKHLIKAMRPDRVMELLQRELNPMFRLMIVNSIDEVSFQAILSSADHITACRLRRNKKLVDQIFIDEDDGKSGDKGESGNKDENEDEDDDENEDEDDDENEDEDEDENEDEDDDENEDEDDDED
jgi:hypothetical protein